MTYTVDNQTRQNILHQIGRINVLAISGGRVSALDDGVELPVGAGYKVRVRLTHMDDYTIERVFVRNGKEYTKGTETGHYFDSVGDSAYRASCFRNNDADYWPEALNV